MVDSVSKLWEFTVSWKNLKYTDTHCMTVFLFIKTENDNFLEEMKQVIHAFIAWWKPPQSLWEFSSRWKPTTASRVFTNLLSNSPKRSPWFSPGYESTENMFYFLINVLVIVFWQRHRQFSLQDFLWIFYQTNIEHFFLFFFTKHILNIK